MDDSLLEPLLPIIEWWVSGIPDQTFPTKLDAEIAARKAFPDENPDKRYARVYYRSEE